MWKMSCRLNFWRFLNGRNTFLKSLLRKLASLEQARLQLSNWGKWKEKFLWEEKLKVFFEVGRYIIPDCEVEDQIHFIASNYQSEENWLHDVCIFFFFFPFLKFSTKNLNLLSVCMLWDDWSLWTHTITPHFEPSQFFLKSHFVVH